MPLPQVHTRDLETLMDALAYMLQTDSRTSSINWILGDVGMGAPTSLPFGYISVFTETVLWYTANGGQGGLAAGLDDWQMPIVLTLFVQPHEFVPPIAAVPPAGSPFSSANLGSATPYFEQPGWRSTMEMTQNVKKVMRTNITVGGAATDTRIVESKPILQDIQGAIFRAVRFTITTQQRRVRGD